MIHKPQQSYRNTLKETLSQSTTPLCLGIDLHLFQKLPVFFAHKLQTISMQRFITDLCSCIFDAIEEHIKIIKWQSAFFEACGWQGIKALEKVTLKAHTRGFLNIFDGKRVDIKSTMFAYGQAAFDIFHADALTIVPYLGTDSMDALKPWLETGKGIYLVLLSSNPSGYDIQVEKTATQISFAEFTAHKFIAHAQEQAYLDSIGFVIGAPYFGKTDFKIPEILRRFPLLIPGVGAQGYSLESIKESFPMPAPSLINVSRDILGLGSEKHSQDLNSIKSWGKYQSWMGKRVHDYVTRWRKRESS